MLAQLFLARYPTGSLISELTEIYQGKFVVRVALEIEGVTRVTAMAAAETIEDAEDTARNRALMLFGLQPATATTLPVDTTEQQQATSATILTPNQPVPVEIQSTATPRGHEANHGLFASPSVTEASEIVTDWNKTNEAQNPTNTTPTAWNHNVTPLMPQNNSSLVSPLEDDDIDTQTSVSPIDLSDALLKIDVTLKRLGWSSDHEKDYLERTYNKKSRQLLTDAEVLEFQKYLEVLAKTGDEMKRLKWSTQQGKDYLLQTYNKRTRALLTHEELLEFLQYLESQPSLLDHP